MKQATALFLMAFVYQVQSQDTIYKKSGDIIPAKVLEINLNDIKFKKAGNLDGPIFVEDKQYIQSIKYANGHVDTIHLNAIIQNPIQIKSKQSEDLYTFDGKFYYKNEKLNNSELESLIHAHPDPQTRAKLQKNYINMLDYTNKQHISLAIGFGIGFAIPIGFTYTALLSPFNYTNSTYQNPTALIFTGAILGAAIRTTGAAISKVNKNKRINEMKKIIYLYNNIN